MIFPIKPAIHRGFSRILRPILMKNWGHREKIYTEYTECSTRLVHTWIEMLDHHQMFTAEKCCSEPCLQRESTRLPGCLKLPKVSGTPPTALSSTNSGTASTCFNIKKPIHIHQTSVLTLLTTHRWLPIFIKIPSTLSSTGLDIASWFWQQRRSSRTLRLLSALNQPPKGDTKE